jgi:hypothetical protein
VLAQVEAGLLGEPIHLSEDIGAPQRRPGAPAATFAT